MTYLEYLQKLGAEKPDKLARLFAVEVDANGILTAENVVTVELASSNDTYAQQRTAKLLAQRDEYKAIIVQLDRDNGELRAQGADALA